jgi:hypothetical protein
MNIANKLEDFELNMVYYLNPIKNTVIDNSSFIRIIYSNNLFILNGIYLVIDFNNIYLENHNNKIKYCFNPENNMDILNTIKNLENSLLKKVNIKNKNISTKILDQLRSGFIKICNEYKDIFTKKFILKISGIWESQYEYGLTYKFIDTEYNIGFNKNYPSVE